MEIPNHAIEHEVSLGPENAVDPDLLVPPSQRRFGGPEVEFSRIRIKIGERPIARDLRTLYQLTKRELPGNLEVFRSYRLWMVTHAVSIVDQATIRSVRQVGYQMRLPNEPCVTVVEMFPQTRFVKKVEGKWETRADLEIDGKASVPDTVTELLDHFEGLTLGGKVTIATKVGLIGRLSFAVFTPVVQAVGVGDRQSEWIFERSDEPLIGDQLMVQILLVPKHVDRVEFEARAHAVVSTFNLIPTRLNSEWIPLACSLN